MTKANLKSAVYASPDAVTIITTVPASARSPPRPAGDRSTGIVQRHGAPARLGLRLASSLCVSFYAQVYLPRARGPSPLRPVIAATLPPFRTRRVLASPGKL